VLNLFDGLPCQVSDQAMKWREIPILRVVMRLPTVTVWILGFAGVLLVLLLLDCLNWLYWMAKRLIVRREADCENSLAWQSRACDDFRTVFG
jgi:hypothetical protein